MGRVLAWQLAMKDPLGRKVRVDEAMRLRRRYLQVMMMMIHDRIERQTRHLALTHVGDTLYPAVNARRILCVPLRGLGVAGATAS